MVRLSINFAEAELGPGREAQPAEALTVNLAALVIATSDRFDFLACHGHLPRPISAAMQDLVDLMRVGTTLTLDAVSGELDSTEAIARTAEIVRQIAADKAHQTGARYGGNPSSLQGSD